MSSSMENLKYHLVFATKYRYNLINEKVARLLKNYFNKQQEKLKIFIQSLAIESNHIHMLFNVENSQQDLNEIVRKLKGDSSFLARKKMRYLRKYESLWTPSHFLAIVGNVSEETIKNYINSQDSKEDEVVRRTFKFKILKPTKCKIERLKPYYQECYNGEKDICHSSIFQDFTQHKLPKVENVITLYIRKQNSKFEKQNTKKAKYWLRIPGSKKVKPFWLGLQGRNIPEGNIIKDGRIREHKGELYFNLVVEQPKSIDKVTSKKILSIDLGFNHPITLVELEDGNMKSHKFYGKEIKNLLSRRDIRLAQLQHSGVEEPNVSRYTESIRHYCHKYVNEIIKIAVFKKACICIGNLSGIKDKLVKGKSSKKTRKKGKVPFYKIMTILEYKAKLSDIPLVYVDEYYTSQRCSRCGNIEKNSRKGERYECVSCGYKQQADVNGALNIANYQLPLLSSCQSLEGIRLLYEQSNSDANSRLKPWVTDIILGFLKY